MMKGYTQRILALMILSLSFIVVVGCEEKAAKEKGNEKVVAAKTDKKADDSKHEGWWCEEHGVPEAECSMCSAKVAKECKAKGDWCDKHERAKSQCFICDPSLKEKFAAQYKAKFGKEPPAIAEEDGKEKK